MLVNQQIDYARDEEIAEAFSDVSGMGIKKVAVDSDYQISYGDVELKDANESSYEKFFFNWMTGEVDAVVMPESFYEFCKEQGGIYTEIDEMLDKDELAAAEGMIYEDSGKEVGIYVEETMLARKVRLSDGDPVVVVFPAESKHKKAGEKFARFVLGI